MERGHYCPPTSLAKSRRLVTVTLCVSIVQAHSRLCGQECPRSSQMVETINNQRKIKLDWRIFQSFAELAVSTIPETDDKNLTVAFVSDRKMRELNKQFRGKNSTTDVLSFPFEADEFLSEPSAIADGLILSPAFFDIELQPPAIADGSDFLGDIIISIEQAKKQADENDLTLELEIKQLILHGVLHLCGYDHETDAGEMNRRELELRDELMMND